MLTYSLAATHAEVVLNKMSKSELVQLVLQTKSSLASQIANVTNKLGNLCGFFRKLEGDVAI